MNSQAETSFNSCSVDLVFTCSSRAIRFYFETPGGGMLHGCKVYKSVECDSVAAASLADEASRARGVRSRVVHQYNTQPERILPIEA